MNYIVQIYEGEINGHGEKEGLPTEYQYEFEQEMLKHVYDLKRGGGQEGRSGSSDSGLLLSDVSLGSS